MKSIVSAALFTAVALAAAAAPVAEASAANALTGTVRKTCLAHKQAGENTNGFYLINPAADTERLLVYCDMTTAAGGVTGGWTLVWSNLVGGAGKLTTDMSDFTSINAQPMYKGAMDQPAPQRTQFEVYTGLRYLQKISTVASVSRGEMRYDWTPTMSAGTYSVLDSSMCKFKLTSAANWKVTFTACAVLKGDEPVADMFTFHNNKEWTTRATDADGRETGTFPNQNCARFAGSGSPFWYDDCWRGSIWGYGERIFTGTDAGPGNPDGFYADGNGAHYIGTFGAELGNDEGQGSGYGWIYVR